MEDSRVRKFAGTFMQVLGEGAYGEVRLLMNHDTGVLMAVKVVDLKRKSDADEIVKKEVKIQSICNHANVLKLLGKAYLAEFSQVYIYLEYAPGGELFDRIEPDVGMGSGEARKYMADLLDGLEYLHQKGIAHRDIKPENLLISGNDQLKIADFGLATLFRYKGRERLLQKRCGTLPYVAPEVLKGPYCAQPADVWSCGIVLTAMLTGELPWDEPSRESIEFANWCNDNYVTKSPWNKMENAALSLIRKHNGVEPATRLTIEQIRQHPWMRVQRGRDEDVTDGLERGARSSVTLSQPHSRPPLAENVRHLINNREKVAFSQPTQNDNILLSNSDMIFTQSPINENDFDCLIKRMTRFFVKADRERSADELGVAFDKLHYMWNVDASGMFTITTTDSRKMQLTFKTTFIDMGRRLLLDFRLSKGCGLEFKKCFLKVKKLLSAIIEDGTN